MRFIALSFFAILICTSVSNAIGIAHGETAPAFSALSVQGETVSLAGHKGEVVVLIFWRTDQERSVLALRDAEELLKTYKEKGVQVFSIIEDTDSTEKARKILSENNIDYPVLLDKDRQIYGDYGVRVFPTTVIVNREGAIAYDIPSHPLTYKTRLRGYIKKVLGEIDERELQEAISPHQEARDDSHLEASRLYNLALKFTESGMYDMAISTTEKALHADPDMVKSHILLGFLSLETKETERALASFNRAIELDPASHDGRTGLGGALVLKGEPDRAIEVLESAAVANPYPQMTYYELGKAYELKGDKDKASEMYRKAIDKIIKNNILPSSVSKCR